MQQIEYDLLVIGGGINGTGIARDAAGRGLSVLLVEQDDLAQHTSSASTKLIHGGLRYLEFFEFGLVREALRERERFLTLAPHLVQPLDFVLPQAHSPRPRWMLKVGLALYDRLGGRSSLPRSRSLRVAGSRYGEGLQSHVDEAFTFADCWVDDSRLVVLNAVDASERGAHILTRTRFVSAWRDATRWRCTLIGAHGEATTVSAAVLVNAAGPWVAELLANRVNVQRTKAVRLVKGSHIIVPRLHAGEHAFMLQNPDRRVVFVIPYQDRYSLIGTTELPIDRPGVSPPITPHEVDYLCASANRYFVRQLSRSDVVRSFSGTRPLFEDAAKDATAVTRDYVLDLDAPHDLAPILSVFGGKLTTYRKLAEQALRKLSAHLPRASGEWTADAPLPGGDIGSGNIDAFASSLRVSVPFLSPSHAVRLARAYGTRVNTILNGTKDVSDLGIHFGADLYQAEVDHLINNEWARTSEDVLNRRSKLVLQLEQPDVERLSLYIEQRCNRRPSNSAVRHVASAT